jgi:hypothetical protein
MNAPALSTPRSNAQRASEALVCPAAGLCLGIMRNQPRFIREYFSHYKRLGFDMVLALPPQPGHALVCPRMIPLTL